MRGILASICLFLVLIISSQSSFGEIVKPTFVEGDFAEYDITVSQVAESELYGADRYEIKGVEIITIDDNEYEARIIHVSIYYNLPLDGEIHKEYFFNETRYIGDSSGVMMKRITHQLPFLSELDEVTIEYAYHPPFQGFAFPLGIGDTVSNTVDFDVKTSDSTQSQSLEYSYEVSGMEQVVTEAGSFNCYVISTKSDENAQNYSNSYYAEEVGGYFYVKIESYLNDELTYAEELSSYKYSGTTDSEIPDEGTDDGQSEQNGGDESSQDTGADTPGFEVISIILGALFLVMVIKRRNR